jgi:hypothetical protein
MIDTSRRGCRIGALTVAVIATTAALLTACTSTTSGQAANPVTTPASGAPASSSAPDPTTASAPTDDVYTRPEIPAAKAITGLVYRAEPNHNHVTTKVAYDATPPMGGDHAQYWADCTGTVYAAAIADENAVHALEHGAVWIAYRPDLPVDQVRILAGLVVGQDRMFMSPYPGLDRAVSIQSWGYQLKVDSATDPRLAAFVAALRYNPATTPEVGATCSDPAFKTTPSTPSAPMF